MSLPLLPLAAAEGGPLDSVMQIVGTFGLNWPNFIAQCFSFIVVAWVLWKFAIKPVAATLDERQKKIEAGLKYAEEMKARLEAAEAASAAQLKEAQVKARELIAEAQKAAKELGDRQQQEAVAKAAALLEKAREAIDLEKKKMLAEARTEIARLVVATTSRVLAKELSELERARYNEAAGRELTNV